MRFTELLNRLTGISCPVFGVSWNPVDTERSIARRIIIFLEPRRVLYSAYDYESVCPCITSVTEIKNYLTSELQNIDEQSELNAYVRSIRNACNKFLSKCPDKKEFHNSRVIVGGTYIEQYNSVINGGLYVPCCRLSCIASLR